ncbi:MAG: sensor histidine kinase [Terriglobales bacterium]
MKQSLGSGRSPTMPLVLGLVITLVAVTAYSWYITREIGRLRELQSGLIERNRRDSLQLLRIQNNLNSLALAMRDMLDSSEPYPLTAWSAQFDRVRTDLNDSIKKEAAVSIAQQTPEQRQYLQNSMKQFWDTVDRMFTMAGDGKDKEARDQIRLTLQPRQAALSNSVARLLVANNESEEAAADTIQGIYNRVQRQVYVFFAATLVAIVLTSAYLMYTIRLLFARLEILSGQRSELAQKLIATQESTLRHVSRELHDEFGQILTAVGMMLTRAAKHAPEESPMRTELREVNEVVQNTLQKTRLLSQSLHPVLLEEGGLEGTLDWYIPTVERQTGVTISYEKSGTPIELPNDYAINVYRVVQESLNNIARHSGAKKAWVRLKYLEHGLEVEIEDHGSGFAVDQARKGIGLVAMRERAELMGGTLKFSQPAQGGTLVKLAIPLERMEAHAG